MSSTIKYARRRNLGNYEHEDLEVMIACEATDKESLFKDVFDLKDFVISCLVSQSSAPVAAKEKVLKPKQVEEVKEEVIEEEKVQVQLPIRPKEEVKEEVKEEEIVKETPKVAEKKATKAKAAKASKVVVYDRELDTHKALIGRWLDSTFRGWNSKERIGEFGKASRALSGTEPFLDENGEILDSFKAAFTKMIEV